MRSSRVFYLSLFNDCNQVCRDSKFETCFKYARAERLKFTRQYRYHIISSLTQKFSKVNLQRDLNLTTLKTIEAIIPFVDDGQYRLPRVNTVFYISIRDLNLNPA